ncbi:MAG: class I SAM-dependent methyltransferase [Eubacteriales bacterium]|nr:class I SAM-dependent methyltransferase [Eubacteriales bacterium]
MEYVKSKKYDIPIIKEKIMGPNPIKLEEELLRDNRIPAGAVVMDLGSGQGVTSVFLAREYGFRVYAADLWSDPSDNQRFFDEMGAPREQLIPVKADATNLPFEKAFFDAVVSVDSYNYFGRDPKYLDDCLLPVLKPGGYLYLVFPGMKRDCHDDLPPELLLSWTPEQLAYMHDMAYWRRMFSQSTAKLLSLRETEGNEELWRDWLECDNEYAVNDRKSMEAGGGKYLNFIIAVLQK